MSMIIKITMSLGTEKVVLALGGLTRFHLDTKSMCFDDSKCTSVKLSLENLD